MAKIILTQDVSGLGASGEVVHVKDGYARNYLYPRGVAVQWSESGEKQVEQLHRAREAREARTEEEALALKETLEAALLRVTVKAGAQGRLFGSIRPNDVAEAAAAAGVGSIDRRSVDFPTPIKQTGDHEALVRLRDDVVATVKLQVVAAK